MPLPDRIEVVITPRDVLTTEKFSSCSDCAFAKALKRVVKTDDVRVGTYIAYIKDERYITNDAFNLDDFEYLKARAESGERFRIKKTLTRVKN